MNSFLEFLKEENEEVQAKGKALKHLTHVEDNILHHGHEGAAIADSHLDAVHKSLLGKHGGVHISTKWDGAPSIVFGTHPTTKQFFVASKSAFNKNPKINYTPEDIEANHGHAPGLVDKLKASLEHLPKITPHGVFQGDLLHTEGDAKSDKGMTTVTPNTITYGAPNGSAEAENMKKKLGIVVHTHYKGGRTLESMNAEPLEDNVRKTFNNHPDVNNVDPTLTINPKNYTPKEQKEYLDHMTNASKAYSRMKPETPELLAGHGPSLEAHVNDSVRKGVDPSVEGYSAHITNRHMKDLEKVNTPTTTNKRIQAHAAVQQHINNNKDSIRNMLEMHSHLQKAKNVLTGVMAKNSHYQHTVDGISTMPEGAVVFDKRGNASKFVNRAEFTRLNFLKGQFSKKKDTENV